MEGLLTAMRTRVLLADDHVLMLEGLARLLADSFDIVGFATNGLMLLEEAERLKPNVVVLDISMPELNGIEAARRLHKLLPSVKIVFITQHLDRAYLRAAFDAGALGYVVKQSASGELVRAIKSAMENRYYVTPYAGREALTFISPKSPSSSHEMFGGELTRRQREILQLVAEGKTTNEISLTLGISPKTVEYHRGKLMNELGIDGIAGLVRFAVAHGIVTP